MDNPYRLGIVRVLTTDDSRILHAHGRILESCYPELTVVSRCIPDQPYGIHDEETEDIAVPKILEEARRFEEEGFDGVMISCCADPGFELLTSQIRIPIISAGRAVSSLALALGHRLGVMSLTPDVPVNLKELLGDHLIGYLRPQGIENSLDLLTDQGRKSTIQAAQTLRNNGVELIVLACTGMATAGFADQIEEQVGIPVIDPVLACGTLASYAAKRKFLQQKVVMAVG